MENLQNILHTPEIRQWTLLEDKVSGVLPNL